jgi:hypothetical protein
VDIGAPGYDNKTGFGLIDAVGVLLQETNGVLTINGDFDFANEDDYFTLKVDGADNSLIDLTINGALLGSVHRQFIKQIVVNGLGGNDTLALDFSNGGFLPVTGITFAGGTGAGNTLLGPDVDATWKVTGAGSGVLQLAGGQVAFDSTQNLTGGAANDTFLFFSGGSIGGSLEAGPGVTLSTSPPWAAWSLP